MSITETPTAPTAPKKQHRRPNRRRPAQIAPPAAKPASAFADITKTNCPSACNEDRCVISGIRVCVHPNKGGLHAHMQTGETLRRFNEAKDILGK